MEIGEDRWMKAVIDYAREQQLDLAIVEQVKVAIVRAFVFYSNRLSRRPSSAREAQAQNPN